MRKFYVSWVFNTHYGYDYVTLEEGQKANIDTFYEYFKSHPASFNYYGNKYDHPDILGWSLVEE